MCCFIDAMTSWPHLKSHHNNAADVAYIEKKATTVFFSDGSFFLGELSLLDPASLQPRFSDSEIAFELSPSVASDSALYSFHLDAFRLKVYKELPQTLGAFSAITGFAGGH